MNNRLINKPLEDDLLVVQNGYIPDQAMNATKGSKKFAPGRTLKSQNMKEAMEEKLRKTSKISETFDTNNSITDVKGFAMQLKNYNLSLTKDMS